MGAIIDQRGDGVLFQQPSHPGAPEILGHAQIPRRKPLRNEADGTWKAHEIRHSPGAHGGVGESHVTRILRGQGDFDGRDNGVLAGFSGHGGGRGVHCSTSSGGRCQARATTRRRRSETACCWYGVLRRERPELLSSLPRQAASPPVFVTASPAQHGLLVELGATECLQ